jgi:hypothetical protein
MSETDHSTLPLYLHTPESLLAALINGDSVGAEEDGIRRQNNLDPQWKS